MKWVRKGVLSALFILFFTSLTWAANTTHDVVIVGAGSAGLDWGGFTSGSVTITRNSFEIIGSPFGNSGSTTDNIGARGGASYLYQACDTGTSNCVTDTVNF